MDINSKARELLNRDLEDNLAPIQYTAQELGQSAKYGNDIDKSVPFVLHSKTSTETNPYLKHIGQ